MATSLNSDRRQGGFLDIGVMIQLSLFFCFIIFVLTCVIIVASNQQRSMEVATVSKDSINNYLRSQTMTVTADVAETFGIKKVHTGDKDFYYVVMGNDPSGFSIYTTTGRYLKIQQFNEAPGDGKIIKLPKSGVGFKWYVFIVNY